MTNQNDPREPFTFPDMSDNTDGYGRTKWDIDERNAILYPDEPEVMEDEWDENTPVNSLGEQD